MNGKSCHNITTVHYRACLDAVVAPSAIAGGLVNVGLQLGRELGQIQEDVAGLAQHWCGVGELTLGVDQLGGVQ